MLSTSELNEPPHDKTNKMTVRWAKTQISLGICPVWSESSLCAHWVAKEPGFLHADSEDWSNWMDAQADLSLRWVHKPFCWFCHEGAQIWSVLSLCMFGGGVLRMILQLVMVADNSFLRPAQYKLTLQQCQNCWPRVNLHFLLETDHKLMSHWQKS